MSGERQGAPPGNDAVPGPAGETGGDAPGRRRFSRRAGLGKSAVAVAGAIAGCPGDGTAGRNATSSPTPTRSRPETPGTGDTSTRTVTPSPARSGPDELYVAPGGDDGNEGNRAEPVADLSTALERAVPGTTVRLRGGTYRPARTVGARGLSGTAERPVVVEGEPGETPVFDFGPASVGGLRFSNCRHVVLRGFAVRNAPSRGLFVEAGSSDVVVADVVVRASGGDPDAGGSGVFVLDSTDVTLRRVDSQNNFDPSGAG